MLKELFDFPADFDVVGPCVIHCRNVVFKVKFFDLEPGIPYSSLTVDYKQGKMTVRHDGNYFNYIIKPVIVEGTHDIRSGA